uniref:Uncharacterized protein n=1 Tax=Buteo japonicus TaxID=224669 RepID=A0A8C0BDS2_9AVES
METKPEPSGIKHEVRHRRKGLLCGHGLSNGGTSIVLQLCILHRGKQRPDPPLAAGGSQPHLHHHLPSPHQGMTQRGYVPLLTPQVLPSALILQREGNTISSKLSAKDFTSLTISATEMETVALADCTGSPWSFSRMTSMCWGASSSWSWRAVKISPLCNPTEKSRHPGPAPSC